MLINVKPKEGVTVQHPETGAPMKAGKIEKTPQVIRLLKDGDLLLVKADKPAKVAKKAPAKQEAK